jgi:hypothetical protein
MEISITDKNGVKVGSINGLNDIMDLYGNKVGELRVNGIFNTYGSKKQ